MTPAEATTKGDLFVRCEPLEVAAGWVYGHLPWTPPPGSDRSPRQALEDAIRPALLAGPCFVTFSGGRDSSAVLATATALARRECHALPVPVTRVYPHLPETDETAWQRAVVDHLGLTDWVRLELRDGETDLLGDAARAALSSRGVLWPPALQTHDVVFQRLGRGSLLTGEGGDAVLGPRRVTPLAVVRQRHRADAALLRACLTAVLPEAVRRRRIAAAAGRTVQHRWLRPTALERHVRLAASDAAAEPLRFDDATRAIPRRRCFAVIRHNHAAAAAEHGLRAHDPLLDPGFVAAVARAGHLLGHAGRTAAMHGLFSDLLPADVLSRSTKASFNRAHAGPTTRQFARDWDGSGVDDDLVDAERLRQVWLSDEPTMAAGVLLHGAWLASRGAGRA